MNEQIRELAERAGAVTFGGKICLFGDQDIEKFAELIVRECADVAFDEYAATNGAASGESAILKHFGVEE